MSTRKRIPELQAIEFTGTASISRYAKEARSLCREMAWEFEMAGDEVYSVLVATGKGHPLLMKVDVRWRARRVRKRLRRAADYVSSAGVETVRFNVQFRTDFADVITPIPIKPAKRFDFND